MCTLNWDNQIEILKAFQILSKNFISLSYVKLFDTDEEDICTNLYNDGFLDNIYPGFSEEKYFTQKMKLLREHIVLEEDREEFFDSTKRSSIYDKLKTIGFFEFRFRIPVFNDVMYCLIKFNADKENDNLVGIVVSITNINSLVHEEKVQQGRIADVYASTERVIMGRTAELIEKNRELERANEETVELLGDVIELRNEESGLHVKRVKSYTRVLAEEVMNSCPEYNLTATDVETFYSASALHDVGKIMIPDAVLLKPGKLTDEEFEIMKSHTTAGLNVLKKAPKSWPKSFVDVARDIAHYHHEKWDGRGYPEHLKGDEIPISAQIVSIADCYDALTSERTYKKAFTSEKAYEMITGGQCGTFSPKLIKCFEDIRDKYEKILNDPDYLFNKATVSTYGDFKLNGMRILLVDDNEFNLEISKEVLEDEGAIVTTAVNGLEAVDIFSSDNRLFDVILMDVVMPEMNGIEATKEIRKIESNRDSRIPIVALTAEASSDNTTMLKEAGCNASMAKPLVVGELTRILVSCMQSISLFNINSTESIEMTNIDSLTKFKNINALTSMISSLNDEINSGTKKPEFAIIECDINELKSINDLEGHEIGNLFIINACELIKSVLKRSPIYRIGGDEFVSVLQGRDYEERDNLINSLAESVKTAEKIDNIKKGKASFSFGMAVFDPEINSNANEVLKKAEANMLERKKLNK